MTAADEGAIDGPVYPISAIDLEYIRENPLHPDLDKVKQMPIALARIDTGYVAPRAGATPITIKLADVGTRGTEMFHASALQQILITLRDDFLARDLFGVSFRPDPLQISPTGIDLRAPENTELTITIATGVVTSMRTVASGDRVSEKGPILPDETVNNPLHKRFLDNSPVRPYVAGDVDRQDLLRKGMLDRYLFHLGRHPGRMVDLTVAASEEVGGADLEFRVTENKPLIIYAQLGNTGTPETDYMRYRVGLMHTQLTESDDVLSLDYQTNFDDVHAVFGSYERPFAANDRVRWGVGLSWNEYTASDVGSFRDDFDGESYSGYFEVIWNFYQHRELFVDLVGGARYDNLDTDNSSFGIDGEGDFFTPYVGLRLDRTAAWFSTQASAYLDLQADVLDNDQTDLVGLGRTDPDDSWAVFRWDGAHSFYLEPLFDRAGWEDPSTPESSTLAHELLFRTSGQFAFGNRLIPQSQAIVGGLNSVRGYPESATAGDSAIVLSAEYRFHIPRAFSVQPSPREMFGEPFRAAPQFVYGFPDWDLIPKAFIDVGWTDNSDRLSFESDEALVAVGFGVDLFYRRNLSVRSDWGWVMNRLKGNNVNSGSNRLQVVATIYF